MNISWKKSDGALDSTVNVDTQGLQDRSQSKLKEFAIAKDAASVVCVELYEQNKAKKVV